MNDIDPGKTIHVKIVKRPSNAAAIKTLVRLLSKDQAVKKDVQRLRKIRRTQTCKAQRGGRQWTIRMVKQRPVKGSVGESGTITATLDVLADLKRVARFVEIQKA